MRNKQIREIFLLLIFPTYGEVSDYGKTAVYNIVNKN